MLKRLPCLLLCMLSFTCVKAQKGNNGLSLNGETAIPFFQNDPGFGLFVKGFYGAGRSAQITLSGGISVLKSKAGAGKAQATTRLVPLIAGYRQNIHAFFLEPRIGFGELGGKIHINGDDARPSVAALFAGMGIGYHFNRIELGLNFLTARGIDNSSAGIWYNKHCQYTGLYVGYYLFGKK